MISIVTISFEVIIADTKEREKNRRKNPHEFYLIFKKKKKQQ